AVAYLTHLIRWLVRHNDQSVPNDLCDEAASEALCNLFKNPRSYDPARQSLAVYLRMSAQGDLRNLWTREQRYYRRHQHHSPESVEVLPQAQKYSENDEDAARELHFDERIEMAQRTLASVRDGLTEVEARALDLMLRGERRTSVFAAACGFS